MNLPLCASLFRRLKEKSLSLSLFKKAFFSIWKSAKINFNKVTLSDDERKPLSLSERVFLKKILIGNFY